MERVSLTPSLVAASASTGPGDVAEAGGGAKGRWARRVGGAVFVFFLVKGLAWLAVPAALAAAGVWASG